MTEQGLEFVFKLSDDGPDSPPAPAASLADQTATSQQPVPPPQPMGGAPTAASQPDLKSLATYTTVFLSPSQLPLPVRIDAIGRGAARGEGPPEPPAFERVGGGPSGEQHGPSSTAFSTQNIPTVTPVGGGPGGGGGGGGQTPSSIGVSLLAPLPMPVVVVETIGGAQPGPTGTGGSGKTTVGPDMLRDVQGLLGSGGFDRGAQLVGQVSKLVEQFDRYGQSQAAAQAAGQGGAVGRAGGAIGGAAGEAAGAGAAGGAAGAASVIPIVGTALEIARTVDATIRDNIDRFGRAVTTVGDELQLLAGNDHLGMFKRGADAAADALEKVPVAGEMLSYAFRTVTPLVTTFGDVVESFVNRGRELSQFSGPLAQANQMADVRGLLMDIKEAQVMGGGLANLTTESSLLSAELREILLPIKQVVVEVLVEIVKDVRAVLREARTDIAIAREVLNGILQVLTDLATGNLGAIKGHVAEMAGNIEEIRKNTEKDKDDPAKLWREMLDDALHQIGGEPVPLPAPLIGEMLPFNPNGGPGGQFVGVPNGSGIPGIFGPGTGGMGG